MRRILVTGSRDWTDRDLIEAELCRAAIDFGGLWGDPARITVVHGDARGADRIAAEYARPLGLTVEAHPADWVRLGRRAGYVRNAEMVSAGADLCLAFILNGSRGATMCADLAAKAGVPVRRFEVTT